MVNIFILTGSGISAESGVQTYRADTGLWAEHDLETVATFPGFLRNWRLAHKFYDARFAEIAAAQPNVAHLALAELGADSQHDVTIVTQNIDDLHERAGSQNVIHIHGQLNAVICSHCGAAGDAGTLTTQPLCACGFLMRPDIVFFGEDVKRLPEIEEAFLRADVFLSIGTAGAVHPAAAYARRARNRKKRAVEFNLGTTEISRYFRETRRGPATLTVPSFIEKILQKDPSIGNP